MRREEASPSCSGVRRACPASAGPGHKRSETMLGRFTARVAARTPPPPEMSDAAGVEAPSILPPDAPGSSAEPAGAARLLSERLLDAKVRLHRRLIEEINLSALEKLPGEEVRKHVFG